MKVGQRFNMKAKFTLSKLCKKTEDLGWSVREKLTCVREKNSQAWTNLAWTTEKLWNSSYECKNYNGVKKKRQDQSTKEKWRREIVKSTEENYVLLAK